jgi:putative tricarboxylic transport membrane protein
MPLLRNLMGVLLGAILLGLPVMNARADFPDKPITVIVPFAAGGGSDTFVRIFQKAIREENLSPQPIVVKNVAGAGGTIGSRAALKAKPDGYTILCLHDGMYTAQHYGSADWGPSDFEPIAAIGRSGVVIAVKENSPFQTLAELMDEAVQRPYELVFGTNIGAPNHYSAMFLQKGKPGAKFRFTQTGGGAKRLSQLKGGHVDLTGFSVGEYEQFKAAGIRAIAVLSEKREPSYPDLLTAKEQGVDAVHGLMQFWWAPKGTPPKRIAYFEDLLKQAMDTETVQRRLANLHVDPIFQIGEPLRETIAERSANLKGIVVEKPPPLPPVHWMVLGLVVICGVIVMREGKQT